MNIEGLLRVASKVGTPLALAGIVVIVFYALYKQVLALKLFAPIGAGPTAHLLQNVLNKLFWLAIIAVILGVASYILTAIFPPSTPSHSSKDEIPQEITSGRDVLANAPGGIMHTGQGSVYVTNVQGISGEEHTRLTAATTKAELSTLKMEHCIDPPIQAPRDIQNRIEAEVDALQKLGSGKFVAQTEVLARNLYADYPNSDRIMIAQMLLSSICRLLSSLSFPDSEKLQRYQETEDRVLKLFSSPSVPSPTTQSPINREDSISTPQSPIAEELPRKHGIQQSKGETVAKKSSITCTKSGDPFVAMATSLTPKGDGFDIEITFTNRKQETINITHLEHVYYGHPVSRSASATDNLGSNYILVESSPMRRRSAMIHTKYLSLLPNQERIAKFTFKRDTKTQPNSTGKPSIYNIFMSYEVFTDISSPNQTLSGDVVPISCHNVKPN